MKHGLAGIRAWAYMMGMPALLVAVATPALLAVASFLPPNLIWLCYLMPVVLASVRWGFASAAAGVVTAGLAGDFFFTQLGWKTVVMSQRCSCSCLPGLAAPW